MDIQIFGSGYVGLVTAACLADVGHKVINIDFNKEIIEMLQQGEIHIVEPSLKNLIKVNVAAGRLSFSTFCDHSATIQIIAVGTPQSSDGSADISSVFEVAKTIARNMTKYKIIVVKSTVPVGTCDRIAEIVNTELSLRGVSYPFSVVSNPEFLKEGAAVADFARPDRIVLGTNDERAIKLLRQMYSPFQRNHERLVLMDVRSAEMTKYASNAMLATRISFMNELANLSEDLKFDIEQVRRGIGSDPRIGFDFLYSGIGYGGSCFPKDTNSLLAQATACGKQLKILSSVIEVNHNQPFVIIQKIIDRFRPSLIDKKLAVWGLSFKPCTDDVRESPSLVLIGRLLSFGVSIVAYDPIAIPNFQKVFQHPNLSFEDSAVKTLDETDAVIIVTEWKEFRCPDFDTLKKKMKTPIIFDGRNLYDPKMMLELGIEYYTNGRSNINF
jgi:UDPglucose 6-dehydrogenase